MIKVLKAGFHSSIQDMGRAGYAAIGVPFSGAMDQQAASLANSIVNNTTDAAVFEITYGGCELLFLVPTIICITGANFTPMVNHKSIPLNKQILTQKNDLLSFGKIRYGVRCYVAIKGGIQTAKVLGSRSFYKNITPTVHLEKGMLLPIEEYLTKNEVITTSIKEVSSHFNDNNLLCYPGPEYDLLSIAQKKELHSQKFTLSKDSNRMGIRLNEVLVNSLPSILTSAVLPGTVQLTPSGTFIVLMRDCQVTGGYPRVLQLSESAINIVAQKNTGATIQFDIQKNKSF